MRQYLIRIYVFVCLWMLRLQLWAQEKFDDDSRSLSRRGEEEDLLNMQDMVDYQPVHISFSTILMVVLLIASCYFFSKIWKGCVFLILFFAALMYFFL